MRKQSLSILGKYLTTWLYFTIGCVAFSALSEPVVRILRSWWVQSGPRDLLFGMIFASLLVGVGLWQDWRKRKDEKRQLPWQGSVIDPGRSCPAFRRGAK